MRPCLRSLSALRVPRPSRFSAARTTVSAMTALGVKTRKEHLDGGCSDAGPVQGRGIIPTRRGGGKGAPAEKAEDPDVPATGGCGPPGAVHPAAPPPPPAPAGHPTPTTPTPP